MCKLSGSLGQGVVTAGHNSHQEGILLKQIWKNENVVERNLEHVACGYSSIFDLLLKVLGWLIELYIPHFIVWLLISF